MSFFCKWWLICKQSARNILKAFRKDCYSQTKYEGDSKSPRKSAAKLLVFMRNSRSVCMLYINIWLTYAQNLNKIG